MLPSRLLTELTQPEVARQFEANPLVILPTGSVEQHGAHLPAGTDSFAAEMIAEAVAERHGRPGPARAHGRRHADAYAL